MARRQPVRAFKVYRSGYIVEVKIYQVPTTRKNSTGYRFRCFMVHAATGEEIVGYDNHWPKGPHRHFRGREETYMFETIEKLLDDFRRDCELALGR